MPVVEGGDVYACRGYRLLTQAEWEHAARAGTSSATYAGDLAGYVEDCSTPQAAVDGIAWWCGNAGGRSRSVGGKTPNGWGLYDMLGNVWEWTWDRYDDVLPRGTDPRTELLGSFRVFRGGSWSYFAKYMRAAYRLSGGAPGAQSDDIGVRLGRTAP